MKNRELLHEIIKKGSTYLSFVLGIYLGRTEPINNIMPGYIPDEIWPLVFIMLYSGFVFSLYWLVTRLPFNNSLIAANRLFFDGKMKGLWHGDGLAAQLKKYSKQSGKIQIKVTRGIDLLEKEKQYGFWEIFQELNGSKDPDKFVSVQALLIIPCFKEPHVKDRYDAHNQGDMLKEEFLETWYEFLKAASKYKQQLKISTRFYFGNHSKWRFYIFSPPDDSDAFGEQIVLFSDYDKTKDGRKTPMYKVIKQDDNIGGFMARYFDEIWDESLTPNKLYRSIKHKKIEPNNKKKNNYSQVHKCKHCKLEDECGNLIEKYKQYLKE